MWGVSVTDSMSATIRVFLNPCGHFPALCIFSFLSEHPFLNGSGFISKSFSILIVFSHIFCIRKNPLYFRKSFAHVHDYFAINVCIIDVNIMRYFSYFFLMFYLYIFFSSFDDILPGSTSILILWSS